MSLAIKEAKKAYDIGEVPVGAVIVLDGKVIAKGHNKREILQSSLAHAEIITIQKACRKLQSWRLDNCEIYITLKPCNMCMGAIIESRIKKIYYGTIPNNNAILFNSSNIELEGNILEEECKNLMTSFFKKMRENKQ